MLLGQIAGVRELLTMSDYGSSPATVLDMEALNGSLERKSPEEILLWAWETYGPDIAASSSFQSGSVPLLHMISKTCPEMPILFLDTGFHFPETLAFKEELANRFNLNLIHVHPRQSERGSSRSRSRALYREDPDLCCYINKVEPFSEATKNLAAWVSGIRRDQTDHRKETKILEQRGTGPVRVHPMFNMNQDAIRQYMEKHDLPSHPLLDQGYLSIGCAPCTRPAIEGQGERSGRWAGMEKTECGLHLEEKEVDSDGD